MQPPQRDAHVSFGAAVAGWRPMHSSRPRRWPQGRPGTSEATPLPPPEEQCAGTGTVRRTRAHTLPAPPGRQHLGMVFDIDIRSSCWPDIVRMQCRYSGRQHPTMVTDIRASWKPAIVQTRMQMRMQMQIQQVHIAPVNTMWEQACSPLHSDKQCHSLSSRPGQMYSPGKRGRLARVASTLLQAKSVEHACQHGMSNLSSM